MRLRDEVDGQGAARLLFGQWNDAEREYKLALELNPNDTQTLGLGVELAVRAGDTALEGSLLARRAAAEDAAAEHCSAYASFLIREGEREALASFLRGLGPRGFNPDEIRADAGRSLVADGHYGAALEAVKPLGGRVAALPIRGRALVALASEKPSADAAPKVRPSSGSR